MESEKKMNEMISVVIPVYNVEKYLKECIDSVLSQDYTDLQIILIDDGSTDCSGKICDEYAELDSRIQVIHQKNGGAAAAKNAGLRVAGGKYLSFLDSDDYLEPGAYSYMMRLLTENNAQVVQCAFREVYRDYSNDQILRNGTRIWATEEYMAHFTRDWTCSLMTDKLFERQLFDGVYFPVGNKIDDEFFTYRGIMNANRIITDDKVIYNYRKRTSSVMLSPQSAERIVKDKITAISERRRTVLERFPQLCSIYNTHFVEYMMFLAKSPSLTSETLMYMKKEIYKFLCEKGQKRVSKKLLVTFSTLLLKRIRKTDYSIEADGCDNSYFD